MIFLPFATMFLTYIFMIDLHLTIDYYEKKNSKKVIVYQKLGRFRFAFLRKIQNVRKSNDGTDFYYDDSYFKEHISLLSYRIQIIAFIINLLLFIVFVVGVIYSKKEVILTMIVYLLLVIAVSIVGKVFLEIIYSKKSVE